MDGTARLVFTGELRELARNLDSDGAAAWRVAREASVKDVIESLGPPHTEVHGITADGVPVDFRHRVAPGECIVVSPATFPIDVTRPSLLRPVPFPSLRFVVDANAGRLATLLRLLGFNACYHRDMEDGELADLAAGEERVALSRDRTCLKRAKIVHGRLIRANDPKAQLRDVLDAYGLKGPYAAFSRCLRCNRLLKSVDKQAILERLLPKTQKYYEEFVTCPACGRIYWAGSHYEHMRGWIEALTRGEEGYPANPLSR